MGYTARLKVFCDNKNILSNLRYQYENQTAKQEFWGKLDGNNCTKVYDCKRTDLIYVKLWFFKGIIATIRIPPLENGEFSKSTFTLKSTSGYGKKADSNIIPVKVKNELEVAIDNLHGAATYFGNNFIKDARLRKKYIEKTKQISDGYIQAVKDGQISLKKAAEECNYLRNETLDATRKLNSPTVRSYSEAYKKVGWTFDEIVEKYSMEIKEPEHYQALKNTKGEALKHFLEYRISQGKSYFQTLSKANKNNVYWTVLKASGKTNPEFNSQIPKLRVMGGVLIIVTAAVAIYQVSEAKNKEKEIYRQTTIVAGGIAGGAAGGAVSSWVCGPGAWICVGVTSTVGGGIGGYAAYKLVDAFDAQLEEFTTWTDF